MKSTKKTKTETKAVVSAKAPSIVPAPAPVAAAKIEVKKPTAAVAMAPKPNRISLELLKPDAKAVYVAGSFNQWAPEKTPLRPAGNGRWIGNLNVNPGRHEYLFVVDGQWLPDPNAMEYVQNPFGGRNSVLIVSE
jgi:1,4-alpha-glucan branching enzyme